MKEGTLRAQGGRLFINLGSYLQKIRAIEQTYPPEQRLPVPSLSELARCAGSHSGTLSRLAQGKVTRLSLKVTEAIIKEMRSRGFQMEIWDLVDYIGPDARPRSYIVGGNGDSSGKADGNEISDGGG